MEVASRPNLFFDRVLPPLLLVLVNAAISGYTILSAFTFKNSTISPIVCAFLRDLVACACFYPTLRASQAARAPEDRQTQPQREHWALFLALGLLGVFSQMLGALSIKLTSALVYGLFSPTVPVFTVLVSFACGIEQWRPREAASWAKVGGLLACVGGAAVLVALGSGGSHGDGGGGSALGYAYLLAAVVSKSSYPVLQKHMLSFYGYPSITLVTWACACKLIGQPRPAPPLEHP